jgi:hypothetical protein
VLLGSRLPARLYSRYTAIMARRSITVTRKRLGRPPTGTDPLVGARLPPLLIGALDEWARAEGVSRSEAVRRLLYAALHVAPTRPTAPAGGTRKRSVVATRKRSGT